MIGRGRNLSLLRGEIRLPVRGNGAARLDQFLKDALAWRSRTRIQKLIRSGRVRVNGREVKPSALVRPGDDVLVRLSEGTGLPDYNAIELEALYEDPWLLALNKPAGMLVHPVGRHVYDTLMNVLHHHYIDHMEARDPDARPHEASRDGAIHLRLCHRIDRDTTGVLLIGKDRYVHQDVQKQFETRQVSKNYLALVEGRLPAGLEEIDRPLAEGRSLEECLEGGPLKPSRTLVTVLEELVDGDREYSWISARPLTGRQNQIRLHMAAVGHPLVGDERFGRGPAPDGFPPRFILHSARLGFHHPRLKSRVELEAPPPADVIELLERLRS